MVAIGLLVGGGAHDFNNLLTAIMGYAFLLLPQLAADPKALSEAEQILHAAERAAGPTRQLLALQRLDLLITDVVMPLKSGQQLVQRASQMRPELPILYTSGYTDHALVHHGQRNAATAFLQKPFTPDRFACKVREILDRDRRATAWSDAAGPAGDVPAETGGFESSSTAPLGSGQDGRARARLRGSAREKSHAGPRWSGQARPDPGIHGPPRPASRGHTK